MVGSTIVWSLTLSKLMFCESVYDFVLLHHILSIDVSRSIARANLNNGSMVFCTFVWCLYYGFGAKMKSSVESQKGAIKIKRFSHWEPEGRYRCKKSMVIAPFWFSVEHLWIVIAPFWLSNDEVMSTLCHTIEHIVYIVDKQVLMKSVKQSQFDFIQVDLIIEFFIQHASWGHRPNIAWNFMI